MNKFIRSFILVAALFLTQQAFPQGYLIPTDNTQTDFLKTYKLMLFASDSDYRFATNMDSLLFPKYGEYSVYWIRSGGNKGKFVLPDSIPTAYSSVSSTAYSSYNYSSNEHYALQCKHKQKPVAIFYSSIMQNNSSVTWESVYFKNIFDSFLFDDMYYKVNENTFATSFLSDSTKLLIIPSFAVNGSNAKYYMDSVVAFCPAMKAKIDTFLSKGGCIYAEGNAVYLIEKLGLLSSGAVDFSSVTNANPVTNLIGITVTSPSNPISFAASPNSNQLYATSIPNVNTGSAEVVAKLTSNNNPAVFVINGSQAFGGRVVCNLGLPAVGGTSGVLSGSKQLQWTLNSILFAFCNNVDVTRSVFNILPNGINAGKNAVAYDKVDTFEVRVKVRNLSSSAVNGINITEQLSGFFTFLDVTTSGVTYNISGNNLTLSGVSVPAQSEQTIVYRLKTPPTTSLTHQNVNNYIAFQDYIMAAKNSTAFSDIEGKHTYIKNNAYAELMFSANIAADADLNWKNILGCYYEPFKVFMIMENKERTPAEQTKYVAYIPKDVPVYWVDHSLNVPVLKTPGGKYVDVLRGSDNQMAPDFDINTNGHPDVWLDTASIFPKGYTIVEDSVYWQNPWHRLATGDSVPYFEDINHDGIRPQDLNNDGYADIGESTDKIRVWKVTWNINQVNGYQVYDPYCSYELWIDPPDLIAMSAGVGYAYGTLTDSVSGMFYPYSPNIHSPNLSDTSWTYWMERDSTGHVEWKQLIYQHINNYEGYTFIDTAAIHYTLLPTDSCLGTVPVPNNEYIAVLSLGGEEIDMKNPTPHRSNYSNIDYKTIFNEAKKTPIRTSYTYYAPLPNPMQFEYLTNSFSIKDTLGNTLQKLPEYGKACLTYNIDASTEYSYYWIRNAGYHVDYNSPSEAIEGVNYLGDGVFGYMIYDIPKGFGDHLITLPKLGNGNYDINSIVQVDGHPYQQWINNPHTQDSISIWEDDFRYHIDIPQLLIPPALCDKNHDGIDDWIDDRGDRFHSQTGYLHDPFMLGDGESYPSGSANVYPHVDSGMAGLVTEGWSAGADNTYGSDDFDDLGKVNFTIHANYLGKGKEGPVEISKGGWMVVEEIMGGSPWAIFSHDLSAYAEGEDLKITSSANPSMVKFGLDTTYLKHTIWDINEPHNFDGNFDPYLVSNGYGDVMVSTYAGGRDPCSLISPDNTLPDIVYPAVDHKTVTLIPNADPHNPELAGYPRSVSGTLVEAMVTAVNGTDDNWINTSITPVIPPQLGTTHVELKYVAYPRPLVPAVADPITGAVTHAGDQPCTFTTGWRFNEPDGEVLVKMGDTLNLMQPTRRAYFMFLISVDESLPKGVYYIGFTMNGQKVHYDGTHHGAVDYKVPDLQFSIAQKDAVGNVLQFQKTVIGQSQLTNLTVHTTPVFTPTQNVKWSLNDVNYTDFPTMSNHLPATYSAGTHQEVINMHTFADFPSPDTTKIFILEQGKVNTDNAGDANSVDITTSEQLNFTFTDSSYYTTAGVCTVYPIGPRIVVNKKLYSINGAPVGNNNSFTLTPGGVHEIVALLTTTNVGSDIATNTMLDIWHGSAFKVITDSLPSYCAYTSPDVKASMGSFTPGQSQQLKIHFKISDQVCDSIFNIMSLITHVDVNYNGLLTAKHYTYPDTALLKFKAPDLALKTLTSNKSSVEKGGVLNLTATATNGAVTIYHAWLRAYTFVNNDTLQIAHMYYDSLTPNQVVTFSFTYTVPDNAYIVTIYTKIDADNTIAEICENNNTKQIIISVLDGPWINNVHAEPNPFSNQLNFYYELGKDNQSISIGVYTTDGKKVYTVSDCPAGIGAHTVSWQPGHLAPGVYYFRVSGVDANSKYHEYTEKMVKE